MNTPKILVFSGSIRLGSVNSRLAGTISKALADAGVEARNISLAGFEMPIYNGDFERENGVPANAVKLGKLISEQDGVVLVSPEYNGSISPLLKNALGWMSSDLGDIKPYAQTFALASCSPGALGGLRGLSHLRDILMSVGADVITPQLSVGPAGSSFNDDGTLAQEGHQLRLQKICKAVIERAELLARR